MKRRQAAGRERPLVLVVEDSLHDWEIYGKILWYNGFDVLYAREGAHALQLARTHRPDLVLLDLGLPDMMGLEVCDALRAGQGTAATPVVVLSARPLRDYEGRARALGCARCLEKPVGPVQVLREVEALIGRPPRSGDGRAPRLGGVPSAA